MNSSRKCIWCLNESPQVTFNSEAHTIPKSLGGQYINDNVCDDCNSYFGNKHEVNYSIEEALKETFNISRRRILHSSEKPKRQVGRFKSRFFDIRERNGKPRLLIKPSFRLNNTFQKELAYYFKRGLYKMYLEELNRQTGKGFEPEYDIIRSFARYGKGALNILYFTRTIGAMILFKREAETPILFFNKMNYLYSNDKFVEIEFLGHVFGFQITEVSNSDFDNYIQKSRDKKKPFFKDCKVIERLTDVDLALRIMDEE